MYKKEFSRWFGAVLIQLSGSLGSSLKCQIHLSFSFEIVSGYVAQTNLELAILLPLESIGICHHMPAGIIF